MAYQNNDRVAINLQNLAFKLHENGLIDSPGADTSENISNGVDHGPNEYVDIPDSFPEWKKEIYRRRNQRILERQEEELEKQKDPYEGQPEWKKPLLRKKDAQKAAEEEKEKIRIENEQRFTQSPRWHQELILKKYRLFEQHSKYN